MCVAFLVGVVARAFAHHLRTCVAAKCQTIVKHREDTGSIILASFMVLKLEFYKLESLVLSLFRKKNRFMSPQTGAGLAQCRTNIAFSMRP
jgi:hypothetical protein